MRYSGKKRNYSDLSSDESVDNYCPSAAEEKEPTDSEEEKQKSPRILTEKEWKNLDKPEKIDDFNTWEMKDDEEIVGEKKENTSKNKNNKEEEDDEEDIEEEEDSKEKKDSEDEEDEEDEDEDEEDEDE